MGRSLRIVGYAVNGSGVGHLMRLVAVCRWIRRYAAHAGVRAEIFMLTSSEADGLCFSERFASFKVPSKTAVADAGIDKITYIALAKQWVWHSLGLLRPDLFLVDTFPRGSFGELLSALDLCKKKAFIYRPLKEGFASRADFQAMLPLYDAILVPEREDAGPVLVPASARARVRHIGPVMARERAEMWPRDEARRALGITGDKLVVYVSAGGGGDAGAERQIHAVCAALQGTAGDARDVGDARDMDDVHIVVGAGPLYRGRWIQGDRITWLAQAGGVAELMAAFDVAVCAAGYNTFSELMHAGVPAIFLPQEKIADEQRARAERAAKAGAAVVLEAPIDAAAIRAAVDALRDPTVRAQASQAARDLVPQNYARAAAAEALRLVLPGWEVDAAEEAVTDDLLAAARELHITVDPFLDVMRAIAFGGDAEDGIGAPDPGAVSDLAVALLRFTEGLGVPVDAAARLTLAVAKKLPRATADERSQAARAAFSTLAPFGDWSGAAVLLRTIGDGQKLTPAALTSELTTLCARLRASGDDLYRGVALLSAACSRNG
jgi:UDP-N-acetylglucosamine--N-acetylmuramyl-(pentapeptide) pyrophosphoryl-undecaprenol N-acetylglucosamine transferase